MAVLNTIPSDDATVSSRFPNYTYGSDNFNQAGWDGNGIYGTTREFCYAWMRFDISSIPAGSTILAATLTNMYFFPIGAYASFDLHITRGYGEFAWSEFGLTFNTQPPVSSDVIVYTVDGSLSGSFEVQHNVTSHVQSAFAENDGYVVWRLHTWDSFEGQASGISLGAKEQGQSRPFLQVIYALPSTGRRRSVVLSGD